MSRIRFQILFGPASAASGADEDWYGWRLMGANNRELGRSAVAFGSYQGARLGIQHLKREVGRSVRYPTTDPLTGRWGWRVELDGASVAVSGRWYERDHDARLGAAKFVSLALDAALCDGVTTVHDRRGPHVLGVRGGGAR